MKGQREPRVFSSSSLPSTLTAEHCPPLSFLPCEQTSTRNDEDAGQIPRTEYNPPSIQVQVSYNVFTQQNAKESGGMRARTVCVRLSTETSGEETKSILCILYANMRFAS